MIRTQVYLTAAQHRALKKEASREGVSMTEMLRRILGEHFHGRRGMRVFRKEAVLSFIALGASGNSSTSERHDEGLDEGFRGGTLR